MIHSFYAYYTILWFLTFDWRFDETHFTLPRKNQYQTDLSKLATIGSNIGDSHSVGSLLDNNNFTHTDVLSLSPKASENKNFNYLGYLFSYLNEDDKESLPLQLGLKMVQPTHNKLRQMGPSKLIDSVKQQRALSYTRKELPKAA